MYLATCVGQTKKYQKLIVAEFRIDTPRVGHFTYLVSYNFEDGYLLSKDTILGAETFKTNKDSSFTRHVRFEFGGNFIYKNKYVVSGTGNVIDIEKRKLLIESGDEFITATGDSILFHRANIFTGTGFLLLNLKNGNYDFINHEELNKEKKERSSPDKKHYLSIDKSKIPYKIDLHPSSGVKKTVVFDAGNGPNITSGSFRPTVETYWINNYTFLYSVHKLGKIMDSSQIDTTRFFRSKYFHDIRIHEFNISSMTDKIYAEFIDIKQGDANDKFFEDKIGQLIYRTTGWNYYLLDTLQKKFIDYQYHELGSNFSIAINGNQDGYPIRYYNEIIGSMPQSRKVVGDGIMAVEKGESEIRIWSNKTKEWSSIKIPWISSLVGWIDE
jgi:hypothetical protein